MVSYDRMVEDFASDIWEVAREGGHGITAPQANTIAKGLMAQGIRRVRVRKKPIPHTRPEGALKIVEVAELMGVDRHTVHRWMSLKGLPHFKAGHRYTWINKDDFEAWMRRTGRAYPPTAGASAADD